MKQITLHCLFIVVFFYHNLIYCVINLKFLNCCSDQSKLVDFYDTYKALCKDGLVEVSVRQRFMARITHGMILHQHSFDVRDDFTPLSLGQLHQKGVYKCTHVNFSHNILTCMP